MGLDLIWRNASGAQIELIADESSAVSAAVERFQQNRSHRDWLIGSIDLYRDTRFSAGQAPQLLREFERLRNDSPDPEERIALGRVLSVLRAAERLPDSALEFIGD